MVLDARDNSSTAASLRLVVPYVQDNISTSNVELYTQDNSSTGSVATTRDQVHDPKPPSWPYMCTCSMYPSIPTVSQVTYWGEVLPHAPKTI